MAGEFLPGSSERPPHEAVKMKPGLCRRPKRLVVPESRMSARESCMQGVEQPQREECVAAGKAGRAEPSKPFDIRHKVTGFGVCPDRLRSSLGPYFFPLLLRLPFGMVMHVLCHCMLDVCRGL